VTHRVWYASSLILVSTLRLHADPPPLDPKHPDPLSAYESYARQSFTIMVNRRIVDASDILKSLDRNLQDVLRSTPVGLHGGLREVRLWVEEGDGGRLIAARARKAESAYFPLSTAARRDVWLIPEKVGGIEIHSALTLCEPWASWRTNADPGWLLHEFAHAMHDQVLGLESAPVTATYKLACARRLYDEVEIREYWFGSNRFYSRRGPAYARTNQYEYFAELSVIYLGRGRRVFPFSKDELKGYDSPGFDLADSFWRSASYTVVNEMPFPLRLRWLGENTKQHLLFQLLPNESRTFDGWSHLHLVGENPQNGDEYRFTPPKPTGAIWRLTTENTEQSRKGVRNLRKP
jgi:hypothetical protein